MGEVIQNLLLLLVDLPAHGPARIEQLGPLLFHLLRPRVVFLYPLQRLVPLVLLDLCNALHLLLPVDSLHLLHFRPQF